MKTLIIYDSVYGNTKKLAIAMADALNSSHEARALLVGEAGPKEVDACDVLVVGSPTQGGRPTPLILDFINYISTDGLRGKKVASFDTRIEEGKQNFALRLPLKTIGYAAPKALAMLAVKGGASVAPPEGFMVTNTKGPLQVGELVRAQDWIRKTTPRDHP